MCEKNKWLQNKYTALLLISGAVYLFLRFISPLVTPVLIAGLFLTYFYPAFDDIQKKTRIKKQYLASALLLLICTILIIIVWMGGSLLFQKIPLWINGLDELQKDFEGMVELVCKKMGKVLKLDTGRLKENLFYQTDALIERFRGEYLPTVIGESWKYVKQMISIIAVLVVTMIATILLAKDYDELLERMGKNKESRMVLMIFLKIIRYIVTFIKAQTCIMGVVGGICTVVLLIAKVENAVFLGILAGGLDALPFVGTGIVLLPLGFWQLLGGHYVRAATCVLAYVLAVLSREFLEPKLIGKRLGVFPVVILISVYAGLKLFGIWGIVKGPLGVVVIQQIYEVYLSCIDGKEQKVYDEEKLEKGT